MNRSGPHVGDRPDQQAAGAAALIARRSCATCTCGDQVLGAAMKSVKVFFLFIILPGVVPRLAQVAAAADVGDGVDHAAVEQAAAFE